MLNGCSDMDCAELLVLCRLEPLLRLASSKMELLEAFARWQYSFYLYRPAINLLVPFTPDASGIYPAREDDNVLAIHSSSLDLVARRLIY